MRGRGILQRKRRAHASELSSEYPLESYDDRNHEYDVIVVGSGAAGGIACHVLANHGLKVLCLEAGPMIDPAKDFYNHKWPYERPYRGRGKPGRLGSFARHGLEDQRIDQSCAPSQRTILMPGSGIQLTWTRVRAVGGRILLWGRDCDPSDG